VPDEAAVGLEIALESLVRMIRVYQKEIHRRHIALLVKLRELCRLHHSHFQDVFDVKATQQAFHALKICFANEIGDLCESLGVDPQEVSFVPPPGTDVIGTPVK